MASLIALSPCAGLLPITAGQVTLSEVLPEAITSVAAFEGQAQAVSAALEASIGVGMPKPNRSLSKGEARIIWTGGGQAMVLGPKVAPQGAALTDQSDAWAVVELEGPASRDVLARLMAIDLRDGAFKRNHTARTLLRHMTCSVTRVGANRYQIMVFRSMAKTAVHDITEAMAGVAARGEAAGT